MKLKSFLTAFLILFVCQGYGQQSDVDTRSAWDGKGNGTIYVILNRPGIYSLFFDFKKFENLQGENRIPFVVRNSGPVMTLKAINPTRSIDISYSVSYIWGNVNARPKTTVIYRLPVSEHKEVQARAQYNIQEKYFDQPVNQSWYSLRFNLEKGDTVYAARKGRVIKVVNQYDPLQQEGVSYNSDANEIIVEHLDGTQARYKVLQRNSILVEEGDLVFPDSPLALAGTYDSNQYLVCLLVCYLSPNQQPTEKQWFDWNYIKPTFATKQGEVILEHGKQYMPLVSQKLVTQEMNKREIKRWTEFRGRAVKPE